MLTELMVKKLMAERADTPNIVAMDLPAWHDKGKRIQIAPDLVRGMAQNLINEIHEHRHLREARVLLIVEWSESTADKLAAGARVSIGKAARANPLARLLTTPADAEGAWTCDGCGKRFGLEVEAAGNDCRLCPDCLAEKEGQDDDEDVDSDGVDAGDPDGGGAAPTAAELAAHHADFVVKLSGDWMDLVRNPDGVEDEDPIPALWLALIDHELLHCGAKIAGEFLTAPMAEARQVGLGQDFVEACPDITRGHGDDLKVLVRYYARKDGRLAWTIRKHDVEEFEGVARRHGAWDRSIRRMYDVLIEDGREVEPAKKDEATRRNGKTKRTA